MTTRDDWLDDAPRDEDDPRGKPKRVKPKPNGGQPALDSWSPGAEWERALCRNGSGIPTKEAGNCALTFLHDPAWQGVLRYDSFADRFVIGQMPPLPHLESWPATIPSPTIGDISDEHELYAAHWLRKKWGVSWPLAAVRAALVYAAKCNAFNPLAEYIARCIATWDGHVRLPTWLHDHFGVDQCRYSERIGTMWLISAIARALCPGCKVDHVLTLIGPQGLGKTRALEILFGTDWFLPQLPDLHDKDAMVALVGKWCACADELNALRRARDREHGKGFVTRPIDVYRPPYGRYVVHRKRTCVLAATTNLDCFSTDETGDRRNWPAVCHGNFDFARLSDQRDQLWGEAGVRYQAGEQWWPEAELVPTLQAEQADRFEVDVWADDLNSYLVKHDFVTVSDCLDQLGIEPGRKSQLDQNRVARLLVHLGWKRCRPWLPDGSQVRGYQRP